MAFPTPRSWTDGDHLTGPVLNAELRDPLNAAFTALNALPSTYAPLDVALTRVATTGDFGANLQTALDQARGKGAVLVPPGSYSLTRTINLGQGDTIYALGAKVTKVSPAPGTMFTNYTGSTSGASGYTGNGDITIVGGIWDANASVYTTANGNGFTFDHAKNITLRFVTIRNISSYHGLELNSIDGARVLHCNFEGWKDNTAGATNGTKEIIQIDYASSGSPESAPFDDTHSRKILIEGCRCTASDTLPAPPTLVGSHARATGKFYEDIRVLDNFIEGTTSVSIKAYAWRRAIIRGNIVTSAGSHAIVADQCERVTTLNNITTDSNGSGVRYTGGTTGIIADNDVLRAKIDSIGVFQNCNGVIVHDNRVADGGAYGIVVNLANQDVVVHHNTLTGNGTDGAVTAQIRVSQGPTNTKITGNTVRKSGAPVEAANALSISSDSVGTRHYANDFLGFTTPVVDSSTTSLRSADDTGWIDCIITAGYAQRSGADYTPQVRLLNGIVYLRGQMDRTVGVWNTGTITPLTLPTNVGGVASFAPPKEHSIWPAGNTLPSAWVRTAGTIGVTGSAATGNLVLDNVFWPRE